MYIIMWNGISIFSIISIILSILISFYFYRNLYYPCPENEDYLSCCDYDKILNDPYQKRDCGYYKDDLTFMYTFFGSSIFLQYY